MPVLSRDSVSIPMELILHIAGFLEPDDLIQLMRAVKGLDQLLTFHHLAIKGKLDETLLHVIARHGEDEWMRMFLAKGVQSDLKDRAGCTPLLWAAYHGHISVVELLL